MVRPAGVADPATERGAEIIDADSIRAQYRGSPDLLTELIDMFLSQCDRQLHDLRGAVRGGDTTRIERAAHGLKGSIGNFFAPAATQAASRLELLARQGEVSRLKGAVDDLDREIARLKPALAALKDGPSA